MKIPPQSRTHGTFDVAVKSIQHVQTGNLLLCRCVITAGPRTSCITNVATRRSKLSLSVSSSWKYLHAKMLDHVLAVQFFVLPRSVVRHNAPSIDGYILETPARKHCEERRSTGHAILRRRCFSVVRIHALKMMTVRKGQQ